MKTRKITPQDDTFRFLAGLAGWQMDLTCFAYRKEEFRSDQRRWTLTCKLTFMDGNWSAEVRAWLFTGDDKAPRKTDFDGIRRRFRAMGYHPFPRVSIRGIWGQKQLRDAAAVRAEAERLSRLEARKLIDGEDA